ncbi:MAG: hypothetical protein QF420_06920 [Alphaproteobacteria bacterium]|nr:hypothetical protein [Alphaproteobacteria bacterium]
MNTIMFIINNLSVARAQAVIEKRYPATVEVINEIQQSKSAMLEKSLWRKLEIYAELKTKT